MTSWQTKPPTKKSYILWGWQYRRNKFICLIYVGQAEYALLIRGPNVFNANKNTMSIIKTIILLRIRTRAEKCTAQFQGSRNWNYFLESAWLETIQVKALTNIIGYHFDLSVIKSELVQTLWGLFLSEGKMDCEIERWIGVARTVMQTVSHCCCKSWIMFQPSPIEMSYGKWLKEWYCCQNEFPP